MTSAESSNRPLRDRLGETLRVWRFGELPPQWSSADERFREHWRRNADTFIALAADRGVRIEVGEPTRRAKEDGDG